MYDTLLNLFSANVSGAATTNGSAKALGRNRSFQAVLRVGGDVTGTTPTLNVTIEESATGTGSWTQIAAFAQVIDEQVGYVATTTPRYEVPGEDPLTVGFVTSKDYVRAVVVAGGTTPAFPLTSVNVRPLDSAYKRSGVA